jgi:hypothetical protein
MEYVLFGGIVMASEKLFENRVKKFLKDKGCWFIKYWGGAAFTKAGIPDLLICCNGYFIAAEIKGDGGNPSDLQLYNIEQIEKAGGIGLVIYPYQFNDFKRLIDELTRVKRHQKWDWDRFYPQFVEMR